MKSNKPRPKRQKSDLVFRYHDGDKDRVMDAWDLALAMEQLGNAPQAPDEIKGYVTKLRQVFGIEEYSENPEPKGLTTIEVLKVAGEFMVWSEKLKKKFAQSQI